MSDGDARNELYGRLLDAADKALDWLENPWTFPPRRWYYKAKDMPRRMKAPFQVHKWIHESSRIEVRLIPPLLRLSPAISLYDQAKTHTIEGEAGATYLLHRSLELTGSNFVMKNLSLDGRMMPREPGMALVHIRGTVEGQAHTAEHRGGS